MIDSLKQIQDFFSKQKLPDVQEDNFTQKSLDIAPKKNVKSESAPKTNLEVVNHKLQEELEDKRRNAAAIKELFIYRTEETIWGRLKGLFIKNEYGFRSFEFKFAYSVGGVAALAGICLRGKTNFQASLARFKVQHNLSIFESKRDYMSRIAGFVAYNWLMDNMSRGLRLGSIGFFSSMTMLGLAHLRNEAKLYDFVAGYALAGFLYRFQKGMRSALSAALIGAALGSLIPLILWPFLYYEGRTFDDVYKEARQDYFSDKLKEQKYFAEIQKAMHAYNISYFEAKKRVQEWREDERIRITTAYNLNREAALNGLRDMSEE